MKRARAWIGIVAVFLLLPGARAGWAQALSVEERAIAAFAEEHLEEAVELLARTVEINSGTMNHDGVERVGAILRAELDALGFETRWIEMPPEMQRAGHLFGRRRGDRGQSVLLIGHLDTVFEADSPFQRFERDGWSASGPGAADMKGGNVAILFALRALDSVGALDGADITVAFTGDEESVGEPIEVARRDLIEAGKRVDVALGFETGIKADGVEYVTVARRSASEWRLEVTGRQAHSSGIFSERVGAGAAFEAARILDRFYDEVRGEPYLTFNAGVLVGGTEVEYDFEETRGTASGKTNIVPRSVVVHGGLRTISVEQLESARRRMREIAADSLPGTLAQITFSDGYPPMAPSEGNRRLMELYGRASEDLGLGALVPLDPGRRGAADISFVAPHVDSLAGLGLHGSGAHGPDETVDLSSLTSAIQRAAILIYRLTRGEGGPR